MTFQKRFLKDWAGDFRQRDGGYCAGKFRFGETIQTGLERVDRMGLASLNSSSMAL